MTVGGPSVTDVHPPAKEQVMAITRPDEIAVLMRKWPKNESNAPALDDESARLDAIRMAEWWLNLNPEGFAASIDVGPTDSNPPNGWHMWFALTHPAFAKPCRCFQVLLQHWKPPRVYQLQFPMDAREFPVTAAIRHEIVALINRANDWAIASNLRDTATNKNIKSIDLYRQFSEVQFTRFTDMVQRFVNELRGILDGAAAAE
jgi:hypothetical protein